MRAAEKPYRFTCNLGPGCRHDHRAKTHADHRVSRDTDGTYTWTTPTGHTYHRATPPLPVEDWPGQTDYSPESSEG